MEDVFVEGNKYELNEEFWAARVARALRRHEASKGAGTNVVCRYWLADKCRSGDDCPYLHRFVADKVPLCRFAVSGTCPDGDQCLFRHYLLPHEHGRRSTL